ncbi:MAG: bifunctional riboflavin kinase/FAD synthetase [Clostridia bacterium]|nr:bifunctional riboflavin kinase/FAD synthetase [Clostridia bacterium]
MNILQDEKIIKVKDSYGIGLGNFDGIHLAHEKLIRTLVEECKKEKIKSMIYTFDEHPTVVLNKDSIKLISTMEKKIEILEELNVDTLCLRNFDSQFSSMEAEEFIKKILVDKYNVKIILIGFNYHFGYKGSGDAALLEKLGREYGFRVITIQAMKYGDEIISSSNIRAKIKEGDMEGTKNLLGKYYSIKGRVEYGNRIGTLIGFPTANIIPLKDYALPKSGVYYTNTIVDGKTYESITNLGFNPTIDQGEKVIIETHIFDFSGWLYGKEIEVIFKQHIRNEVKFADITKLKEQILIDIDYVKKIYGGS